jgi:hypothetical protein
MPIDEAAAQASRDDGGDQRNDNDDQDADDDGPDLTL